MKRLTFLALTATLLIGSAPASAQSRIGCSIAEAERYEQLVKDTKLYQAALGPNLVTGNFPGKMRDEVLAFTDHRTLLYRDLENFIKKSEDLAWAIRTCVHESSR